MAHQIPDSYCAHILDEEGIVIRVQVDRGDAAYGWTVDAKTPGPTYVLLYRAGIEFHGTTILPFVVFPARQPGQTDEDFWADVRDAEDTVVLRNPTEAEVEPTIQAALAGARARIAELTATFGGVFVCAAPHVLCTSPASAPDAWCDACEEGYCDGLAAEREDPFWRWE